MKVWRLAIDALNTGKIGWETFFQRAPLASLPGPALTTTESGDSLLHLGVRAGRSDIVEGILAALPHLKWHRNHLNLSPLDLARFLPRETLLPLLQPGPAPLFKEQPNVLSDESLPNIDFLYQPLFESEEIFDEILSGTKKAKIADKIPPEKIWMGIYFDKEIQTGTHPKLSIRFINDKVGFGVFAEQRIPSCAFVGEYRGVIKEGKKKEFKDKLHCVRYTVWEMGRRRFVIDAEKRGNFTRFINHSAKPNLSLQSVYWRGIPRMIFVALKEILPGMQLTFDYGTFFWKECSQIPVLFE